MCREKSGGCLRPGAAAGSQKSEGRSGWERISSSSLIGPNETIIDNRLLDSSDLARPSHTAAFSGSCLDFCRNHKIFCSIIAFLTLGVIGFLAGRFSASATSPTCPKYWLLYEGKCYLFSDAEGTWNSSQKNCTLYGASLVLLDTPEEMAFVRRYKSRTDYWIGLRRKAVGEPWKWPDGSDFNKWFKIGADGLCAYLNYDAASSTWCHTLRNWICRKFLHAS
ncbi:C-type lectin domain family 2 member B-like isoform X2 [Paroedura picta]|uniref:C-type lectin domain family 2 member B-like isoform X2 n=1 Tax=Paroedura picta TaxID=143630 RepID=UPI00405708D9